MLMKGQKPKRKMHKWTAESELELIDLLNQGFAMKSIAERLVVTYQQVQGKVFYLKKINNPLLLKPRQPRTPGPEEKAQNWVGGRYWRLPPKQTWHKGMTGRLVHICASRQDTEDEYAKST